MKKDLTSSPYFENRDESEFLDCSTIINEEIGGTNTLAHKLTRSEVLSADLKI